MDLSTTPNTICSAKEQTPAPVPATPSASNHTQSPLSGHTPCTPGRAACTLEESLFAKVAVHTAKCTECDKRNMDTMRRCPGCTFQVCQPCYEKRQREGKGLVHGNMPLPGSIEFSISSGSSVRTARKRLPVSMHLPESPSHRPANEVQEQLVEETTTREDCVPFSVRLNTGKRVAKKPPSENSGPEESLEDKSDSDNISPTPRKRFRVDVSVAGSAFTTTIKEPPITRATLRSSLAGTYDALTSVTLEASKSQLPGREPSSTPAVRRASLAATHEATESTSSKTAETQPASEGALNESLHSGILYENAIKPYKEPLLTRREPVLSNPVAHIPAMIRRGGKPRPSAEQIYQNIQEKVREKLKKADGFAIASAQTLYQMATQSRKEDESATASIVGEHVKNEQAYTIREPAENASSCTVRRHIGNEQAHIFPNYIADPQAFTVREHHGANLHVSPAQQHVENPHASPVAPAQVQVPTIPTFQHHRTFIPAYTVRDFVQAEAIKYQNNPLLNDDDDDRRALYSVLQSGALIWGKQTYTKLSPESQRALRPGLNLRLDAIDGAYTTELRVLMAEHAARMIQDLLK